jgi:hypothetical protein
MDAAAATSIATALTANNPHIVTIGIAVLGVVAVIVGFNYVRRVIK